MQLLSILLNPVTLRISQFSGYMNVPISGLYFLAGSVPVPPLLTVVTMRRTAALKSVTVLLSAQTRDLYFRKQYSSLHDARQRELMAKGLPKRKAIPGVKQILIVASGKGGVGKSTVAVNIAVGMKCVEPQKEVALLDADVHGPSVPLMMNLHERPLLTEDGYFIPLMNHGVKCMSSGFLADEKSPFVWRGPMVMSAIQRLLRGVAWGSVDYLIIDTPPGTGDAHLSLIQNVPVSGVILVTTPQTAAVQVTERGAQLFKKLEVPICGIVENMASVVCTNCHSHVPLWGRNNKAAEVASDLGTELLCSVPLSPSIAECTDFGAPIVISHPDSEQGSTFITLAKKISAFLSTSEHIQE
ncbi:iron-sulfur protein NUBPL isoform X4 [Schistocerca gregaria]|uniref:iron-sulfur protein NUBPL isoform X4 n=1 Tax=Schistocerca gregaria TaxID=7010 RepID=UPI00211EA6A8|nr:iron-sulfur protein NUBPL isoform X4 [Schistocerca gregaria]XP_049834198.1 iron-sulfur protein NUBPL isoform X4 [Schistocerca gregaria]XP_049834199.1 iron-sulfur protein NUBPL isoform X4 [Schistocerca gregaria]